MVCYNRTFCRPVVSVEFLVGCETKDAFPQFVLDQMYIWYTPEFIIFFFFLFCFVFFVLSFFFSSRRRHTRCSRDWSSDVCSSDLRPQRTCCLSGSTSRRSSRWGTLMFTPTAAATRTTSERLFLLFLSPVSFPPVPLFGARSEEHTSELQSRLHLVCRLLLGENNWTPVTATSRMTSSACKKQLTSSPGYISYTANSMAT